MMILMDLMMSVMILMTRAMVSMIVNDGGKGLDDCGDGSSRAVRL
jgi:hypothetical protein